MPDYLMGVVAAEMPVRWSRSVLATQMILAHTYVRQKMWERRHNPYDVESTTQDQVYRDVSTNRSVLKKLRSLVNRYGHIVMVDNLGQLASTPFHAHCGGGTGDPICRGRLPWVTQVSAAEWIVRFHGVPVEHEIERVSSRERVPHVRRVKILSTDGQIRWVTSQQLREVLGYNRVRSEIFRIESPSDGRFLIRGFGWGHGRGFCQWGAKWWAAKGLSVSQILGIYFPNLRQFSLHDSDENLNGKKNNRQKGRQIDVVQLHRVQFLTQDSSEVL